MDFGPIIHRDLKLDNMILTSKDPSQASVKLIDFGLAKMLSEEKDINESVSQLSAQYNQHSIFSTLQNSVTPYHRGLSFRQKLRRYRSQDLDDSS